MEAVRASYNSVNTN
uniref:Uncharacterized protein n=1 Tax=Anguilla anguilla TaxID=7936 RepID=A0A0E9TEJ5_ANGAN